MCSKKLFVLDLNFYPLCDSDSEDIEEGDMKKEEDGLEKKESEMKKEEDLQKNKSNVKGDEGATENQASPEIELESPIIDNFNLNAFPDYDGEFDIYQEEMLQQVVWKILSIWLPRFF